LLKYLAEVDKERASLENVPSNFIESVCMPEFDDFFQQGGTGYPLPEHKVTPVMNGSSNNASNSGASSSTTASFIDGKCYLILFFLYFYNFSHSLVFIIVNKLISEKFIFAFII
jgi:hypothetical protein